MVGKFDRTLSYKLLMTYFIREELQTWVRYKFSSSFLRNITKSESVKCYPTNLRIFLCINKSLS
jgi:hypothetical protein